MVLYLTAILCFYHSFKRVSIPLEICYKKKPSLELKGLFPFGNRHLTPLQITVINYAQDRVKNHGTVKKQETSISFMLFAVKVIDTAHFMGICE